MPDADYSVASVVAERLRKSICSTTIHARGGPDGGLDVSISVGVALFDFDNDTGEEVLRKADKALYEAKRQGRNRCIGYLDKDSFEKIGNSNTGPSSNAAE